MMAPPGLRPLIYGDAPCDGSGDLRVLVVDGSGADHQIAVLEILPPSGRWPHRCPVSAGAVRYRSRTYPSPAPSVPCPAAPPPGGTWTRRRCPARWTRTPGLRYVWISTVGWIIFRFLPSFPAENLLFGKRLRSCMLRSVIIIRRCGGCKPLTPSGAAGSSSPAPSPAGSPSSAPPRCSPAAAKPHGQRNTPRWQRTPAPA